MSDDHNKTVLISSTMMENKSTEKYHANDILEPYLVVLSGPDKGKLFKLDRQENRIGRDSEADIVLNDPKISRFHATIIILPDEIILEDNGSTNGTYIDGKTIIRAKVELISRIQVGNTGLKIDFKKLDEAKTDHAIYQAANLDALTGILNRGAFMLRAQERLETHKRTDTDMAIVLCDVDHFKAKNDTYGHLAGDHILKTLAGVLTDQMRENDLLARYGGEEFIMLLQAGGQEISARGEGIRNAVDSHPFEFEEQPINTTISIGICSFTSKLADSLQCLIQVADGVLYSAKKSGRNQVVIKNLAINCKIKKN